MYLVYVQLNSHMQFVRHINICCIIALCRNLSLLLPSPPSFLGQWVSVSAYGNTGHNHAAGGVAHGYFQQIRQSPY